MSILRPIDAIKLTSLRSTTAFLPSGTNVPLNLDSILSTPGVSRRPRSFTCAMFSETRISISILISGQRSVEVYHQIGEIIFQRSGAGEFPNTLVDPLWLAASFHRRLPEPRQQIG